MLHKHTHQEELLQQSCQVIWLNNFFMDFPQKINFWFEEYFSRRKFQGDPLSEIAAQIIWGKFTRWDFPDTDLNSFYTEEIKYILVIKRRSKNHKAPKIFLN